MKTQKKTDFLMSVNETNTNENENMKYFYFYIHMKEIDLKKLLEEKISKEETTEVNAH